MAKKRNRTSQKTLNPSEISAVVAAIKRHTLKGILSSRTQEMILDRFTGDGQVARTLREISEKHGLSLTRIRDITVNGIRRARRYLPPDFKK